MDNMTKYNQEIERQPQQYREKNGIKSDKTNNNEEKGNDKSEVDDELYGVEIRKK